MGKLLAKLFGLGGTGFRIAGKGLGKLGSGASSLFKGLAGVGAGYLGGKAASDDDEESQTAGMGGTGGLLGAAARSDAGSEGSGASGGSLPSIRQASASGASEKMGTEKLLVMAINYLSSIDSSLKNMVEFDRFSLQQDSRQDRETSFEGGGKKTSLLSGIGSSPTVTKLKDAAISTALLALAFGYKDIAKEVSGFFGNIGDEIGKVTNSIMQWFGENPLAIAAVGTAAVGAAAVAARSVLPGAATAARATGTPGTPGAGTPGAKLTPAEIKILENKGIKYNPETGRYHGPNKAGVPGMGSMIKNADALDMVGRNKIPPGAGKNMFNSATRTGGKILSTASRALGPLAAVGLEGYDYYTGEKEVNARNLTKSGGALTAAYAGAAFGATLMAPLAPFTLGAAPVLGGLIGGVGGYFGGGKAAEMAYDAFNKPEEINPELPYSPTEMYEPRPGGSELDLTSPITSMNINAPNLKDFKINTGSGFNPQSYNLTQPSMLAPKAQEVASTTPPSNTTVINNQGSPKASSGNQNQGVPNPNLASNDFLAYFGIQAMNQTA